MSRLGFAICLNIVLVAVYTADLLYADVRMPSVFSDNMVLQKDRPVMVRGWADAGEKVSVEFAGQRKEAVADKSGRWSLVLDPLRQTAETAEMRVTGRNAIVIRNVLVGDVWLASGQSNMALSLKDAADAAREIAAADYPAMRFFMVKTELAPAPKEDCAGEWRVCTPDKAGAFSAVAYFFARELHLKYRVPMGVMNSAVGASPCQAWTPAEVLLADQTLPQPVKLAPENYADMQTYRAFRTAAYDRQASIDPGVRPECLEWAKPGLDVADWRDITAPGSIESQGLKIDGAVWFRREVEVPASWAGRDLALHLGPISDNDIAFMNGERIGSTESKWSVWLFRGYKVPANLVKAGRNVIAVRVFDRMGEGGFCPSYPDPLKLADGEGHAINLGGVWKCKVELALKPATAPVGLPEPYGVPSGFFNAMIAPLVNYPLRGFIWYQGEGNAGAAKQHDALFPAMIRSWRDKWGDGRLPFYFVQLASFRARVAQPSDGGWPRLRESQLKALAVPGTGMAVTIDIGDAGDIHPKNKQDVGRRLARWAMRDCYGDTGLEVSGPLYESHAAEGGRVRIRFKHVGGGLTARGGALKGFAIAGSDKKFSWAQAEIDGESVLVWSESVQKPLHVRYAWADNPECTLCNGAGLPASPFRTDRD
ncbi:MAG TPA: sialate O-acetylesterase [Verrucomicrobiae bacterium]|nr:sialate O-acetylesterase [Verrucomicrobiae bacterium]